ncbi:MAG TPA: TrkA C-terminal domain-containing protein, partial [Thermoanaerobaculia bacterium]
SYYVHPALPVCGAAIEEIPLPDGAAVLLVVRWRQLLAPRGDTRLQAGDHVHLLCGEADLALLGLLFGRLEK